MKYDASEPKVKTQLLYDPGEMIEFLVHYPFRNSDS